ncbi:CgeB family protein [Pandoraea bronchicola]|uniref:Spore protein YkvP/CgeB glycosyl transferase-like domain-containing protein n=1 Tax=Pandoraea bronchicola TaxID=2508287 RepID=A0A5E5BUD5_9BURK|nr:glycosyltransferase [Pandoraea bronchicola]VVE89028.1 hypothetical protein PBR20603_02993 [Pandoraea bronchicola]
MKICIIDTYYARMLAAHYARHPGLQGASYAAQHKSLIDGCYGTSDFYSRHLSELGCEVKDVIANSAGLQRTWAREHGVAYSELALRVPPKFFRVPLVGSWLAGLPGLMDIALGQIRAYRPDVLYCQDISFFPGHILERLRADVGLIVGQIAAPLPPDSFIKGYDLILTSFPHFVDRLRGMGCASEYFRIGFDTRVLSLLGTVQKDIDSSFVGGISRHHLKAVPLLDTLAKSTDIAFFGYGAEQLPASSPIRQRHHGEVWGMDMYRALARSRVTVNRHINVAENNANNMRLYEATGVGAALLTDKKDNLGELFEIDKEIITYSTAAEAVEKIRYYKDHPDEADAIARAGQARTLKEHTYALRMAELLPILKKHFKRPSARRAAA